MESTTNKTRTIARRRSRLSLNWIDFLVIAAIVLTFVAIVTTTLGSSRESAHDSASSTGFSTEAGRIPDVPS